MDDRMRGRYRVYSLAEVKASPIKTKCLVEMKCRYCGTVFYVRHKTFESVSKTFLGYIPCTNVTCREEHKKSWMSLYGASRRRNKAKEEGRTMRPFVGKPVDRGSEDWLSSRSRKNDAEEKRINEDFKNYSFGPGDVFYDEIVVGLKDKMKKEE